jgi:hypothetical protein
VEHLTEVAQNPDLFPRTRISRRYADITGRLREGKPRAGAEQQIADLAASAQEKREIARLYAEQMVDDALGDVGATVDAEEPIEIELEIITQATHAKVTARRAKERAGT